MALIIPTAVLKQMKAVPKADRARIIEALEQVAARSYRADAFRHRDGRGARCMAAAERGLAGDLRH